MHRWWCVVERIWHRKHTPPRRRPSNWPTCHRRQHTITPLPALSMSIRMASLEQQ